MNKPFNLRTSSDVRLPRLTPELSAGLTWHRAPDQVLLQSGLAPKSHEARLQPTPGVVLSKMGLKLVNRL